jgi:membrane glycosyltransferase
MLFLVLSLSAMAALIAAMHRLLATNGLTGLEIVQLICFALTTPWAVMGFWNAVIGFSILRLSSDSAAYVNPTLRRAGPDDPITARVALTLFVRHEQASAVIDRLRLMRRVLEATGFGRRFHFFLLSASAIPEYCAEEERLFAEFQQNDAHPEELIYRRRPLNAGFKAGNMRDFCERWGDDYDLFVPLDADSLMNAKALLRLVRVMQANPNLGILQTLVVGATSEPQAGFDDGLTPAPTAPDALRAIVKQTAHMGLCSQTHHEHLMLAARAALNAQEADRG